MVSEIDLLREDISRLEKKFGVDNPFVEVLKAQLASLQNQTRQQPQRGRYHREFVIFKRSQIWKRIGRFIQLTEGISMSGKARCPGFFTIIKRALR